LDLVDKTIILQVCTNCRISYESLARVTGLSPNAVKNRVASLLDSGAISMFNISLEAAMINGEYYLAVVKTDGTEAIDEFLDRMGGHPSVGHLSLLASAGGGAYLVWGAYMGAEMLSELREFLAAPEEVTDVELHTVIGRKGRYAELANLHLRVLSVLREDPRMLISDIAKRTNLSPKTVRRAIREIVEGGGIVFSARPDMAAGHLVNFYVRFEYDERMITREEVAEWLMKEYPSELWDPTASATEPAFFAEFVADNLQEAERIARGIRSKPFVTSTATLVSYSNKKYEYYPQTMLDDLIREAGY
jgi:DNA-binding Lrp family transcriptional regulator